MSRHRPRRKNYFQSTPDVLRVDNIKRAYKSLIKAHLNLIKDKI